jgi:hypothetical protein
MNKTIPSVFPLTLDSYFGKSLFVTYVHERRDELDEKFGEYVLTTKNGKTGSFKIWGYSDVKAEAISETAVRFTVYDYKGVVDRRSTFATPLDVQNVFEQEYPLSVLADCVEKRRREIAEAVFEQRKDEARKREIDAVYAELFAQVR